MFTCLEKVSFEFRPLRHHLATQARLNRAKKRANAGTYAPYLTIRSAHGRVMRTHGARQSLRLNIAVARLRGVRKGVVFASGVLVTSFRHGSGSTPASAGAFFVGIQEQVMATGTVKWFNSQKGYGFIQPNGGGKDVFVHISAVERAGLRGLNEGQAIEYEIVENRGKTSAENLKVR
jgi:cold shock protein